MKYGLSESTIDTLRVVCARHPQARKAVLYGSLATGNDRSGFDIDLTLFGKADLTHAVLNTLYHELDDLSLPSTIDLSLSRDINAPDQIEHIQRRGGYAVRAAGDHDKVRRKNRTAVTGRSRKVKAATAARRW